MGGFFRFYQLGSIPAGIFNDEAYYANDGLASLQTGHYRIFYPDNNGREGLFIWIMAGIQSFMDPSAFSLRLAPAFIGLLTLLVCPFMVYNFLRSQQKEFDAGSKKYLWVAAFATMFFLATSYWHINFSRVAFRAILDPLFSSLSILFISIAFIYPKKYLWASMAGLFCGMGILGYGSYKFMVFPITIFLIIGLLKSRKNLVAIICIVTGAILSALPMLLFISGSPDVYFSRLSQVSVFATDSPAAAFWNSFTKQITMLFWEGDKNFRHNFNAHPQLHPMVAIFFVIGWIQMICILVRPSYKLSTLNSILSKRAAWVLLIWWLSMVIPGSLTFEGQPHALRAIGMIIPTFTIAGIGLSSCMALSGNLFKKTKLAWATILSVLACILVFSTTRNYFYRFAKNPDTAYFFHNNRYKLYQDLIGQPELHKIIVVDQDHPVQTIWDIQPYIFLIDHNFPEHNTSIVDIEDLINQPQFNTAVFLTIDKMEAKVKEYVKDESRIILYQKYE